jgi:hypothetical protein
MAAKIGLTIRLERTCKVSLCCSISCWSPLNRNVVPLRLSVGTVLEDFWLVLKIQGVGIGRTALHDSQQGKG